MWILVLLALMIPVIAITAFVMTWVNRRRIDDCASRFDYIYDRIARMERLLGSRSLEEPSPERSVAEPQPFVPPMSAVTADAAAGPEIAPASDAPQPVHEEPAWAPPWEKPSEPAADFDWWGRIEEHLGKRWMTWAGALALFVGVGFFVKYAIDHQWIGPTTRVCVGAAFGIVLAVLGCRFLGRKMRALGQGLVGAGLAMLYVSLYAAFEFYGLIPQGAAFVLMVLVSATGMTLAALHNAQPIALLAILGGFLTPYLVSTGRDERDILFTYVLLLDVSVVLLTCFRRWRVIELLAFMGTAVLFGGWFYRFYKPAAMLPTLRWIGAFYATFAVVPFFANLMAKRPVELKRLLMALSASVGAFSLAHHILYDDHPHTLSYIAMAIGACSLVLGVLLRKRLAEDKRSAAGQFALAMFFLTLSVPIRVGVNATTLCWAVEAPLLLYLGHLFEQRVVRLGAGVVLLLSVIRLFVVHMPLHTGDFALLANQEFATAMSVPVACVLFALIHHLHPSRMYEDERVQKLIAGIAGGFLILIILHVETSQWFDYRARAYDLVLHYRAWSTASILWSAGAAAFLALGCRLRSLAVRSAGLGALPVAIIMALLLYAGIRLGHSILALNLRFSASLTPVSAALAYAFTLSRSRDSRTGKPPAGTRALHGLWLMLLLVVLSLEVYKYFRWQVSGLERARSISQMALTVTWGLYAAALLAGGFWRRVRALRFGALSLFGLAALKLLIVDIADIKPIYRIVSFVAVGLLMIAASYLYHRLEKLLSADVEESLEAASGSPAPPDVET